MKSPFFVSIFILFLLSFSVLAQTDERRDILKKFDAYRDSTFQEKLFVHIDQDFHLTGELLWFRIFYVDANLHRPASVSKVAYIELLDKSGAAVLQSKVSMDVNGGRGSLFIPATMATGSYVFRAYTRWMRNADQSYYFHKRISIVNPFVRPETSLPESGEKGIVALFPEGGKLVAGLKSRVGVKATNANGKYIDGSGWVVRGGADTVATFTTTKFGLGSFYFTPRPGGTYRCVFAGANGETLTTEIPAVSSNGYVMELKDTLASDVMVTVNIGSDQGDMALFTYLFVHVRNQVVLAEARRLSSGKAVFLVPKASLPGGVAHFTIFDDALRPVAERLYFTNPRGRLDLTVTTSEKEYATRRKVAVKIISRDKDDGLPVDMSMSVYRLDSLSAIDKTNIVSYLYLESDLAGSVDSAMYYFNDDREVRESADNLMLTHGWRRFSWDNVLKGESVVNFIPEVRSHLVSARILSEGGSPVPAQLTYLSSPGKLVNLYAARTDKNGFVHFEVRDFSGPRKLILQTNMSSETGHHIEVINPYDERDHNRLFTPLYMPVQWKDRLAKRSLAMQVQDIFYRDLNDRVTGVKIDSTAFYGIADETFLLDDYTRFPVMEEVMREYVPGVLVRKRRDKFHFLIVDKIQKGILSGDPLVLLDGVPVFDVDKIMEFDPLKVRKLEVVNRNFYVGPLRLPGIVSYSTYSGDLAGFSIDPSAVIVNYEGLQPQREFYAPDYGTTKQRASRMPDQRSLLHWIPSIKLENGQGLVEFYTSDLEGDFVIITNGLAPDGRVGTASGLFSVRKANF